MSALAGTSGTDAFIGIACFVAFFRASSRAALAAASISALAEAKVLCNCKCDPTNSTSWVENHCKSGKLLERQPRCPHELLDDRRTKALANGLSQIAITRQVPSQHPLTAQLVDYGFEFAYHSVAYYSDKCRIASPPEEVRL